RHLATLALFLPYTPLFRSAILRVKVVAVGLDLQLCAARGHAPDHLEEMRVQHRLAARKGKVGHLARHQLVDYAQCLVAAELIGEDRKSTRLKSSHQIISYA